MSENIFTRFTQAIQDFLLLNASNLLVDAL